MSKVAPKCQVHAVSLPLLTEENLHLMPTHGLEPPTIDQLGIFAKEHIGPGDTVLNESSVLTANNRLYHPLCDACSSELPDLTSADTIFTCDECDDTVFCSQACLDLARKHIIQLSVAEMSTPLERTQTPGGNQRTLSTT
jgi:hypothetical protein